MADIAIAHISDTHLGYRQFFRTDAAGRNLRALDVERAYGAVVDDVLSYGKLDLIVHTGDVFHHSRPSWSAIRCFIEQTRRLEGLDVPIIVIAGNHDTPQLRTPSSVFSVLELALPSIRFVVGYEEVAIDLPGLDLNVIAVPHGRLISGPLKGLQLQSGRRNILLTHGLAPSLADSPRHEIGETWLDQEMLDPGYDAILLGHFHKRYKVDSNTWYAGSSERIGWNDADTRPGWSVVRLREGQPPEAIERLIPARQMITLDLHDCTGQDGRQIADAVLKNATAFAQPDAMVRIELTNAERAERRAAESILRREAAGKFLVLQTYSRQDNSALFNEEVRIDESLRMKGLTDLFADFCAEQSYDDGFRARFRDQGLSALQTAIRNAEATAGDGE